MEVRKTWYLFAVIICVGVLLCGCGRTTAGLSEGTYAVQGEEGDVFQPAISFDLEENRFAFQYDLLSSYFTAGQSTGATGK